VQIVPVGLSFEAKWRFRSRVRVQLGAPLDPQPESDLYAVEPRAAVRVLTRRIEVGLQDAARDAVQDPAVPASALVPPAALAANPVFVLGWILNWLPYHAPGWISARLATTADEPATYKLVGGMLIFPVVWAAETFAAAWFGGAWLGLAMAVAAPASGYAALRIWEATRDRTGDPGAQR
jgi:hypothetical protein